MLPLHQAYEVRTAVLQYLRATFRFKDSDVGKEFFRFIEDERTGLFKGPYVSLKTPFVKAAEDEEIPLDIKPGFRPHLHQIQAFQKLTTHGGHQPEPTLLTTGTGSGKTECFLYPVLDYVYQMNRVERQKGVKVIIMYPMNALASDQAKRLAETIWGDERLKGKVTAGLFIGEGEDAKNYPTQMGEHHIIENRESIVNDVPDILLTNFKMLDYGLMQQRYMKLWDGNLGEREPLLRFIVLDELHTYDGAQGTDVANLIRRLKLKLTIPQDWLTPVGTSATIGNGEESKRLLCDYATDVFGEKFFESSIIEEHRVPVSEFFEENLDSYIPSDVQLKKLSLENTNSTEEYLNQVRTIWLPRCANDPLEIGERVKKLQIVKDLLTVTTQGILSLQDLLQELGQENNKFLALHRTNPTYARNVVESLLALISESKVGNGKAKFPMLYLQIQLWQRELSGIQRFVQPEVEFTWRDAIPHDDRISLPIYYCRDCGASGWLTMKKESEQKFATDASKISQAFMNKDKDIRLMNTKTSAHQPIDDYLNTDMIAHGDFYIHPDDLTIGSRTDDNVMSVYASRRGTFYGGKNMKLDTKCPLCMNDSLSIVGHRTSTLSSVAVSQVMSSDFDSKDIRARKMLTFSNSVQDSAHLAGFYEVRTFRFLFRQSIQQYLNTVGHAVSLRELQEGFKTYWKAKLEGDEYYYRFLPGELIEKLDLSKQYRDTNTGELTDKFKAEFDLRVDWEICSEFGFMSQRGRTLEKMGSSATYFKESDLRLVFHKMEPWLRSEESNLHFVADNEMLFISFANGILHRLRSRGGIDHPFLQLFRTKQLKTVMLNWPRMEKVHFLHKRFGRNRIPHMMGYQRPNTNDEVLDVTTMSGRGNKANWYSMYFVKSLMTPAGIIFAPNPEQINDFYIKLLDTMCECMILDKQMAGEIANYAIRPDALYIEPSVNVIKCDICESRMCVAKSDTLTEETHCLDYKCVQGKYAVYEPSGDNYYKKVYNRDLSPRIYAHEHTGLLDRKIREEVENEFKNHPTAHSTNVLTATSTLEMGIDIGDLNVVANTGIPPKPSNFLQRVGRAGRKEGSALVLNYAKSGKHDMFYFAEPLSMMEGKVSTPGCFLEAKDILRRHFFAYSIDSWTSSDKNNIIPARIEFLHMGFELLTDSNFFVNRIAEFIKVHQVLLTENFRKQYPASAQEVLDNLFEIVTDGTLIQRVMDEFDHLITQLTHIKEEKQELKQRLDAIPMNDEARRKDIQDQNKALRSREKALKEQSVVEFMTNAGLLPNYAFPETGVKLSATIFSRPALGDDAANTPEPKTLELVRQASQGIRELAPGNKFYTQKMRLQVKGLSLNDRTDSLKTMRFCSECDAIAEEGTPEFTMNLCPKCGSESWHSNSHKYLKFTTATTSVFKDDSVMDDSKEDREQERFHTIKHFQFNHKGPVSSYGLKNVSFGIEFCKDVKLTEVNYGNKEQLADPTEINKTQHISLKGFVTCKYCGKTTSVLYGKEEAKDLHYPYCNHKDVKFPLAEDEVGTFEYLYLYRTMHTEAIKVLLPVQLFDTEASTQLFKAGLELGMRYYYKSNPEHIKIDVYNEYNKATQNFDNYLVIYDTIPGGTGYLSKLYDKTEFTELIRHSYEHIRDCECRLEGKDGCYHCILSYGNQWQRQILSRERAEQLFKEIYDECVSNNWEDIHGSVGTITTSGRIEDSELESLFVKTMEKVAKDNNWTWTRKADAINETYTYELTITDDDMDIKYAVTPQYRLGPSLGVSQVTKPDFQFICSYAKVKGEEMDPRTIIQWSVYLDGYAYHASENSMGFYNDFKRREAIRLSDREPRLSWTLTWSDIKPYIQPDETTAMDDLFVSSPNGDLLAEFENTFWRKKDSLSRFIFALTHPEVETLKKEIFAYLASCWTDEDQYLAAYDSIEMALEENAKNQYADISDADAENYHFFAKTQFIPRNPLVSGSAWVPFDQNEDWGNSVRYNWELKQGLDKINKEIWEDFWRRYNILQFFSNQSSVAHQGNSINLTEILELFPGLEDIVTDLVNNGVKFDTDGGYELRKDDIIIAEAAIKIDDKNIVIDDFEGREDEMTLFIDHGFTVYTPETFNINEIKNN